MNICTSCGGELRYDIDSGRLLCSHCGSTFEPEDYDRGRDYARANLLTCPSCGAQIIRVDNSAAEYCSYCGSFVMQMSSETKGKWPQYIIPFKMNREDCKTSYAAHVRRNLFAPRQLRDPDYLERFCGFYIPYWVYDVGFSKEPHLQGFTSTREGDYLRITSYDFYGDLQADMNGITYDASASFDDNISERIGPFQTAQMKPFTPSYLFGFSADTADVPSSVYRTDARNFAADEVMERLMNAYGMEEYQTTNRAHSTNASALGAEVKQVRQAMLPVWFLTWRKKDRVAYSVVNGENGKIYAEIPLDLRKFFLGVLLCALPLFALLELLVTITAQGAMMCASLLSLLAFAMYHHQIHIINARAANVGNKGAKRAAGYQAADTPQKDSPGGRSGKGKKARRREALQRRKRDADPETTFLARITSPLALVLILGVMLVLTLLGGGLVDTVAFSEANLLIYLAFAMVLAAESILLNRDAYLTGGWRRLLPAAGSWCAVLIPLVIQLISPPQDWWYYLGAIAAFAGMGATLTITILFYNRSITREVPKFFRAENPSAKEGV